jgi:hypothetical protein
MQIAPYYHELGNKHVYEPYNPPPNVVKYQALFQKNIEEELEHQRRYHRQWDFATRRFNLIADPIKDDRLSNVLVPIIRSFIMARRAALSKMEMDVTYIPNYDDEDKVDFWKDSRRYVHNKSNDRYQMNNAYLWMCLYGGAPLFNGYRTAYQTVSLPDGNGGMRQRVMQDPKNSMIFREAIMPWNYMCSGGGTDQHDAPHHTLTKFMTYDQWVNEFARVPGEGGKRLYMYTECVQPGKAYSIKYDQHMNPTFTLSNLGHQMVCVHYHWIPTMNIHIIESNGVINWLGRNPHKHGRAPFSMLRLHPQVDVPRGGMSINGMGDPWLLGGLDTLYQSVMGQFVDKFYWSNASVIGLPQGAALDLDDEEFSGATVIRGAEKMIVSPLGTLDGQSFQIAFTILDKMSMWATQVPIDQLTGGRDQTAFEVMKHAERATEGQILVMKNNESYGLKRSEEMTISDIFQFLPKEEYHAITDPDMIESMVKQGKIRENDVYYEDGMPCMIRQYPMIETKDQTIMEKFVNNMPVAEGAKMIDTKSGRLPARPEYIRPTDWYSGYGIPDVMVDASTSATQDSLKENEDLAAVTNFAIKQNDRAKMNKEPPPFDETAMNEDLVKMAKKNPRKWLTKYTQSGSKIGRGNDMLQLEKQLKDMQDQQEGVAGESLPAPESPQLNLSPSPLPTATA